jgi:sterol 3beta-glucosyltransferase
MLALAMTDISTIDPALYKSSGKGLKSSVNISEEGRINVSMHFNKRLPDLPPHYAHPVREFAVDHSFANPTVGVREGGTVPRMSIVVMIVGSRGKPSIRHDMQTGRLLTCYLCKGDVQPFLALGQQLLREGHRVRIATHGTFRSFVQDAGLEFFDIGGDPHDLMSYMVKSMLTHGTRRHCSRSLRSRFNARVDFSNQWRHFPQTKDAFRHFRWLLERLLPTRY